MPICGKRLSGPLRLACLLACLGCQGCYGPAMQSLGVPSLRAGRLGRAAPEGSDSSARKTAPEAFADAARVRAVLAQSAEKDKTGRSRSVWIRAVGPWATDYRWTYPSLELLLSRPSGPPNLHGYLADADPVVAANAAIALARNGDGSGAERLTAAVRTPEFLLPMRCAAVEALAALEGAATVKYLRELVDEHGRRSGKAAAHYVPELHAELIRGLARHVDAADDPRFVDALRSPAAEVRLEALAAWATAERGSLPIEVLDLRANGDYRVRAAALQAMAKRRHAQAEEYATAALRDNDIRVRMAAIAALGELGGSAAQATLQGLLEKRQAEQIRTASVAALARMGARKAVLEAASDESWRVRIKVADALAAWPDGNALTTAGRLLDDPSTEVQRAVVAALARWPLAQSGPILMTAMGKDCFLTRKTAAEQLAARWPPAAEFPVEGPAARRSQSLGQLQGRFRQEFGGADRAALAQAAAGRAKPITPAQLAQVEQLVQHKDIQALRTFGPGLIAALEQLVLDRHQALPEAIYREVLPGYGPVFAALGQLGSAEVSQRRRAADQLATLGAAQPLGRLAVARLAQLLATEADPLVWRSALSAVANDPSEPSLGLAYTAIGHASPEVRRRACEHLAAHADPQHAKVLITALRDSSQPVVCAAVRALGAAGRLDDAEPLRRLSATTNEQVRLETAVALVRLGDPAGGAALERMAYSNDPLVQRQVALVMGEVGDPSFTPTLIRLLDGHVGVCRAALESLPKTVGRDVAAADGRPPENTAERIRRWKQWYQQQATAVIPSPPP